MFSQLLKQRQLCPSKIHEMVESDKEALYRGWHTCEMIQRECATRSMTKIQIYLQIYLQSKSTSSNLIHKKNFQLTISEKNI